MTRAAAAQATCLGDCNGTDEVDISDLITGVNIALGSEPLSACAAFDNGTGKVTVDVLITAVGYALNGCPALPTTTATVTPIAATATPSTTPSSTRTRTPTRTATTSPTPTETSPPTNTPTVTPTGTQTFTPTLPPFLKRASKSGPVAVSDDEKWVVLVNPQNDSLSIFAAATNIRRAEIPVGREPAAVVIHPNDTSVFVANRADATVVRIDAIDSQTPLVSDPVAVGSEPTGLALSPSGGKLFVAEWAEGHVSVIDTATMTIVGTIDGLRNPRAIAVTNNGDRNDDDETVLVSEFYGEPNPDLTGCPSDNAEVCDSGRIGRVRRYNVSDLAPQAALLFAPIDSGFAPSTSPPGAPTVMTAPNQLAGLAVQAGKVYVTSVSASPQPPINFQANVFPVLYVGDLATGMEDRSNLGSADLARLAFDQIPEDQRRRFLQEIVDLAFDGDSNVAYVVSRAADIVQRLTYDPAAGIIIGTDAIKQINVAPDCENPIGIAVAPTRRRAYLNCWVTRRLGIIDLDAQVLSEAPQSAPLPTPGSAEDDVNLGRRFYFTGRGRWSNNGDGYSSCGSCHPDGLSDGITWSFATGPRQTTAMDGSFSHGAGAQRQRQFNWTGIFDEIHDFERNTRTVSGGLGAITTSATDMCGNITAEQPVPLPADGLGLPVKVVQDTTPGVCTKNWDMIESFVRTIRPPRARRGLDPAAVARGAALFSGAGACNTCHAGPAFTASRRFWMPSLLTNDALMIAPFEPPTANSFWSLNPFEISGEVAALAAVAAPPNEVTCGLRRVDTYGVPGNPIATAALEQRADGTPAQGQGGFNIPSLYGLSVGAPYFHHGQARSLAELLSDPRWAAHRTAGNGDFAPSEQQLADLVAYLYSIDADAPEPELREGFDGCPSEFPTFVAALDGGQEVPPVASGASASAVLQLDAEESTLTYEVRIAGIDPAQITQAHLHVGPSGFEGPVVLFLANGPPAEPVLKGTLTAADLLPNTDVGVESFADLVAALRAGDVYVNVHTMAHGSGEIRGQVRAPIRLVATLGGNQEVPSVDSTATGTATFELSADRTRLRYQVDLSGLAPEQILQAHLHVAPAGVNGPVVLFLAHAAPTLPLRGELSAAELIPNADAGIVDFADFVDALLTGHVYANVHTVAHPGGEVRGQVAAPQVFPVVLSGDQEVPAVPTGATGRARLALDADGTALRFALATEGIAPDQILQAHLHAAPRGFNGPVILFLAHGGFGLLRVGALSAADLIPNADAGIESFTDFVAALRDGDVYANVHTVANSSGEVRGQALVPTSFVATLAGADAVPPVSTGASAQARLVLAPDEQSLHVTLATDLSRDQISAARIHVAPHNQNADATFFLSESGFGSPLLVSLTPDDLIPSSFAPTYDAFLTDLRAGLAYVTVDTTAHPDGELRGYIQPPLRLSAVLSGDDEVPPVTTTAGGRAQVVIDAARTRLRFALAVSDLASDQITQAPIHVGAPGVQGPVAFFLANGGFSSPRLGTLTAADFLATPEAPTFADFLAALLDDGTYVNVHTLAHQDGEIRGPLQ